MAFSKTVVDRIIDGAGGTIIDPAAPVQVPSAQPVIDNIVQQASFNTNNKYNKHLQQLHSNYAGSGQVEQKSGIDNFITDDSIGAGYLFHTKEYPSGNPLISSLSLPLDSYSVIDRREDIYFNINGKRIKYDGVGGSYHSKTGDTTWNGLTSGILFPKQTVPNVEANASSIATYKQGDIFLLTDITTSMFANGDFATSNANITAFNADTTVAYDAVAASYTITAANSNVVIAAAINTGINISRGIKVKLRFSLSIIGTATLDPMVWLRNSVNDTTNEIQVAPKLISPGVYEVVVETLDNYKSIIIAANTGGSVVATDAYTLDNVVVTVLDEQPMVCIVDTPAGDLFANASNFIGTKTISKQDLVFIECWDEAIAGTDMVYPLGNVQYMQGDIDGLTGIAAGAFTGADTYSLFGNWQAAGDLVGKGYVWSALSTADQVKLASNPDNNIYLADGVVMQTRYRTRVVSTLANDWVGLDQFSNDTPLNYVSSGGVGLRLQGANHTVVDFGIDNGDLAYTGYGKDKSVGAYGRDGLEAVPLLLVQRRNAGVWHPVYNPNGCAGLYQVINAVATSISSIEAPGVITNTASCLSTANIVAYSDLATLNTPKTLASVINGAYILSGTIESNDSGRSDNLYVDEINSGSVEDMRMDATKIESESIYLKSMFDKVINGKHRATDTKVMLETIGSVTITSAAIISSNTQYGKHGYYLSVPSTLDTGTSDTLTTITPADTGRSDIEGLNNSIILHGSNGNIMHVSAVADIHSVGGALLITPNTSNSASELSEFNTLFPIGTTITISTRTLVPVKQSGEKVVCDIIGDPAIYPAEWLAKGIDAIPNRHSYVGDVISFASSWNATNNKYVMQLNKKLSSLELSGGLPAGVSEVLLIDTSTTPDTVTKLTYMDFATYATALPSVGGIGYTIDLAKSLIIFSPDGIDTQDATLDSKYVLLVTYKTKAVGLIDKATNGTDILGDVGVVTAGSGSEADYLVSELTDKFSSRTTTQAVYPRMLSVSDQRAVGHNGLYDGETKISHEPYIDHSGVSARSRVATKLLPTLAVDNNSITYINTLFKDISSKQYSVITPPVPQLHFGFSLGYDNDILAVGNYTINTVYIYNVSNNNHTLIQTLTGSYNFGISVALHNNVLAVGAYTDPAGGTNAGRVDIFKYDNQTNQFTSQHSLIGTVVNEYFGGSVGIYNNTMVVGSHGATVSGSVNSGLCRVYDISNITNPVLSQTISSPVVEVNGFFGSAVSIDNGVIVISAYGRDAVGTNSGEAYIFQYDASINTYVLKITFMPASIVSNDWLNACAIHNNVLLIAIADDPVNGVTGVGVVYSFTWDGNNLIENNSFTVNPIKTGFGASITMKNNRMFIGGTTYDNNTNSPGTNIGRVYEATYSKYLSIVDPGIINMGDDSAIIQTSQVEDVIDSNNIEVTQGVRAIKLNKLYNINK